MNSTDTLAPIYTNTYEYVKANPGIGENELLKAMPIQHWRPNRCDVIRYLVATKLLYTDGVGKDGACFFAR